MGSLRANAIWLGMVATGVGIGVLVVAAWPEPTLKVVRLPYGEAQPKTPPETAATSVRKARRAAAPTFVSEPAPLAAPEEEAGRVLALVEPSAPDDAGPAPVPSELELDGTYVQESPEELGAEPLPGAVLTPPVAR